jgi:hypothetical protein
MAAATGSTDPGLKLTQIDTRDDNTTCLQVASTKGTHDVTVSPDGCTCNCLHFETAPSLCRHLKFCAEKLKEQQKIDWSELEGQQWLNNVFPTSLVYQAILDFFATFMTCQVPFLWLMDYVNTLDLLFLPPPYRNLS